MLPGPDQVITCPHCGHLARLLDARKPPERLMKAEVARQQGKFDAAIALLEKCPQRYRDYAEQMLVFARAGDNQLRPLDDNET